MNVYKKINMIGVHWKMQFSGGKGVTKKTRYSSVAKMGKVQAVCRFKEGLDKKEVVVFLREGWCSDAPYV